MTASRYLPARIAVGVLIVLFAVAAATTDGVGGVFLALGLVAIAVAAYATVVGHALWAFVPNRKRAGVLAGVAVLALIVGGALLPARAPSSLVAAPTTKPVSPTAPAPSTLESAIVTTAATTTVIATTTTTAKPTTTTAKPTTPRPKPTTTTVPPAPQPVAAVPTKPGCDPSYPTLCLPLTGPDLDCKQITQRRFPVRAPDRHGFDGNGDGIGCEG
ncbi:hypothetical protein [Actinokineospora sp. HUAS TT18]|uniref:hypothetical protein n=1 Tax=Actinokineospora sp. HUAS TT18 TaxID=3447451 RepID=UPI003F5229C2